MNRCVVGVGVKTVDHESQILQSGLGGVDACQCGNEG